MKHIETKQLNAELIALINYCVENKVTNFTLNYALNKNLKRITTPEVECCARCVALMERGRSSCKVLAKQGASSACL